MLNLETGHGPLVSIVIGNYNYGRFIRSAICSALAQTYKNIEIVVVDDGSTDSSRAVIDEFVLTGAVKAIYQSNEGQYSAYNAGFAASSGDIVMFLDADDMYLPEAARVAVAAMNAGTANAHFRLSFIGPEGELRERTYSQGIVVRRCGSTCWRPKACCTLPRRDLATHTHGKLLRTFSHSPSLRTSTGQTSLPSMGVP